MAAFIKVLCSVLSESFETLANKSEEAHTLRTLEDVVKEVKSQGTHQGWLRTQLDIQEGLITELYMGSRLLEGIAMEVCNIFILNSPWLMTSTFSIVLMWMHWFCDAGLMMPGSAWLQHSCSSTQVSSRETTSSIMRTPREDPSCGTPSRRCLSHSITSFIP